MKQGRQQLKLNGQRYYPWEIFFCTVHVKALHGAQSRSHMTTSDDVTQNTGFGLYIHVLRSNDIRISTTSKH
jgi:hypothetical protein